MLKRCIPKFLSSACCAALLLLPSTLHSAVLEEVIVAAQLREQSPQDVPALVGAMSGDKMAAGLNKI